ncbi:MAG: enoyl-CoA hydratase [Gemmatimonadetes bacterium]|nr:enoyl-CoA hydratase [Gemmatimonadota bacterium]
MKTYVRYEPDAQGIVTITLDRPRTRNGFDDVMASQMVARFREATTDPDCRLLIVTGAGDSFCAGGDLRFMEKAVSEGRTDDAMKLVLRGTEVVRLVHGAPMPVIAALNGPAVGGGASLALACDLRLIREDARIHLSYAKLGLIPAWGGSWFLPRLVGESKALELLLAAEPIEAPRALSLGLVNAVIALDEWEGELRRRALAIAEHPAGAVRSIKQMIHSSSGRSFEHVLAVEEKEQRAMFESYETRERLSRAARPGRRETEDGKKPS